MYVVNSFQPITLCILLILDYQIKNGKKLIRAILLYEFKVGCTIAKTARNVNQVFGQAIVNKRTSKHYFRRFCNGDDSLEDEEGRGRPLVIDDNQLRVIITADSCKTTPEVTEELNVQHSTFVPN
uniref:HTH_48 domain-containing protein n=1 Tax=Heterorhabditis bacteriophora TaxID=37862 RepID=A0A1I7XUH4_HETBA